MRAWSGLIRLATVLAPVAILLLWGGAYLLACAEFLANPGVPLEFTYKTPGGDLVITAESYVLNTKTGDLTVVHPKIKDPQNVILFHADRIDAEGLPLLGSDSRRAVVTARNAYATIKRGPDGKFDLFDYLPEQEGPTGDFPFALTLDKGTVKFVEASGARRYVQNVFLSDIRVDGVGDRWLASGGANLENVGDLSLSLQNSPTDGVWFRGNTKGLELSELFRVFRQTPEGKETPELLNVDARSLVVTGPFEVYIPKTAGTKMQANLIAEAEGFRYGKDYQAERARFEGIASATGAQGKLSASDSGLAATFEGIAKWENDLELDGNLDADTRSLESLPTSLKKFIPKQIAAKGPIGFDGRLAYSKAVGWRINGQANAASIDAYEESIAQPIFALDYSSSGLTLVAKQGSWRGSKIDGNVAFDTKSRNLSGSLKLTSLNLDGLAKRFKIDRFSGTGDLDVLVTGTLDKPVAYIRAESQSTYAWSAEARPTGGRFTLAATLKDNRVRFDQAYFVTPAGSISANGTYDLKSAALDLDAVGSGIDLDRFDSRLEGIGRFKAKIGGTASKPRYEGTAELFGLKIQDQPIPVITGGFMGDLNSLTANNLRVVKGASQAQGEVSLRFRDLALNGKFQALGVQLSDFLGEDYLATIDLPDARLSGTISKPTFNATATAREIVILGSKIDMATAVVSFKNDLLEVDDFEANKGLGSLQGFLSYDVAKRFGQANFTAEKIALQDFFPPDMGASLTAELTGEAGLTFDQNGFKLGSGEGKFANVTINETPLGGGDWKISADGVTAKGDLFVGGLTSSIDLTGLTYNMETKAIGGNVWMRNFSTQDLYKIAKPYISSLDPQITTKLEQSGGTLGISADLGGTVDNLDLANGSFSAENLTVGEPREDNKHLFGTIKSSFNRTGKRWNIDSFLWNGGPIGVNASGNFTESGGIDIDGRINDADLSYLSYLDSSLSSLVGKIDSEFSLTGTTKDPVLRATPFSDNGGSFGGIGATQEVKNENGETVLDANGKPVLQVLYPLNFAFSELKISNWNEGIGGVEGQASINYAGYSGNLKLNLPFRFPFDLVAQAPVNAELALNRRSVKDIEQLTSVLDAEESEGEVGGNIVVSGTKENLRTEGGISLLAERLVLKQGGQQFRDVKADLIFQPNLLAASVVGNSGSGGSITADAKAQVPSLDEIIRQFRGGSIEDLLASPVSGAVKAAGLTAKIPVGKDGNAAGVIDTTLNLGGTLKQPSISGDVELAKGAISMPSEFEGGTGNLAFPFNPLLNVTLRTTTPAKFKSSTADIDMVGTGTVQGSLTELNMDARLRVDKGQLRLPTARVNLEPGGTIRPTFTLANGVSEARLDVELEGKTRVVAPSRYGQGAQRYDITLDVRGDLLKDGGLALNATSDPPELTQDEILALLGQVNLIEGLAGGFQSGNPESQIRNAVLGIAVPYLLDPVTSQIANAFGLDYLTLDINALEGATIYFAKSLGKDFILQGSRQVSQTNQNYPIKYDVRLSYQLRFGRRSERRRLNFILGLDEMRPWKIAVEYTFRF